MGDIVVLGAKGVGKTAFVKRFFEGTFENKYSESFGIEARPLLCKTENPLERPNIYSLPAQQAFSGFRQGYYKPENQFVLVIDVTQEDARDQLDSFIDELDNNGINIKNSSIYVIANKIDQKNRLISKQLNELKEELEENCQLGGFFGYSAKTDNAFNVGKSTRTVANVKDIFNSILKTSDQNAEKQQEELKVYEKIAAKKDKFLSNFINAIRCYLEKPENSQKMQLQKESLELHYALENNLINSQALNQEIRRLFITESQLQQLKSLADEFSKLKRINESTGLNNSCASTAILHLTQTVRIIKTETTKKVTTKSKVITNAQLKINEAINEMRERAESLSDANHITLLKQIAGELQTETDNYFKAPSESTYPSYRLKAKAMLKTAESTVQCSTDEAEKLGKIRLTFNAIKSSIDTHGILFGFFYHIKAYGCKWIDPTKEAEKKKATLNKLREYIKIPDDNMPEYESDVPLSYFSLPTNEFSLN